MDGPYILRRPLGRDEADLVAIFRRLPPGRRSEALREAEALKARGGGQI